MTPRKFLALSASLALLISCSASGAPEANVDKSHNVILFVADGLRAATVDGDTAPNLAALRDAGVDFRNSHAIFPTLTTVNAAALATGHYPGDTGDWANVICLDFAVTAAQGTTCPFLESDAVLGELDRHYNGDYLHEGTLLAAARAAGYGTATVGKMGPTLIQDHTAANGNGTIVIDDATGKGPDGGSQAGIPLPKPITDALAAAGLPASPPATGVPNIKQQEYFVTVFTKAVLPTLKARGKPFLAVFWSRDPDGSEHGQTESKGKLTPGINGNQSLGGITNVDDNLSAIRDSLKGLGLEADTDIIVVADHGFSTIYKESRSSISTKQHFPDVPDGDLPVGFLAIDLARGLSMRLFEVDGDHTEIFDRQHLKRGVGIIGSDPAKPDLIVVADGGSDLIYLPQPNASEQAKAAMDVLLDEDYVSGIFVRDDLGEIPGTLPFSAIGLQGAAVTDAPAMIVNFKSFSTGCDNPLKCAVEVADTPLEQGQGMHGSFNRADTANFQAAIGPDFRQKFADTAPSSNADIAPTIAHIMGLALKSNGRLMGRVLSEALPNGAPPAVKRQMVRSKPAGNGLATVVETESVGDTFYYDEAGFPGRTVGLPAEMPNGSGLVRP
jgi:arylsulfatase A-like enzyme